VQDMQLLPVQDVHGASAYLDARKIARGLHRKIDDMCGPSLLRVRTHLTKAQDLPMGVDSSTTDE